jgi:hypothetical protein
MRFEPLRAPIDLGPKHRLGLVELTTHVGVMGALPRKQEHDWP